MCGAIRLMAGLCYKKFMKFRIVSLTYQARIFTWRFMRGLLEEERGCRRGLEMKGLTYAVLICGGILVATLPASASPLPSIPSGTSDGIFVVGIGGPAFNPGVENETNFEGTAELFVPTPLFEVGIVHLLDADGTHSDSVFIQNIFTFGTGVFEGQDIALYSDPNLPTDVGFPVLGSVTETGAWQDIGPLFSAPTNLLYVYSDIETPLPAALPLFASGLGGLLGLFGWRRKRKAAAAVAAA